MTSTELVVSLLANGVTNLNHIVMELTEQDKERELKIKCLGLATGVAKSDEVITTAKAMWEFVSGEKEKS